MHPNTKVISTKGFGSVRINIPKCPTLVEEKEPRRQRKDRGFVLKMSPSVKDDRTLYFEKLICDPKVVEIDG